MPVQSRQTIWGVDVFFRDGSRMWFQDNLRRINAIEMVKEITADGFQNRLPHEVFVMVGRADTIRNCVMVPAAARATATRCQRIFVCSPLRATSTHSFVQNVEITERLCRAVIEAGHYPFAPHLLYPRFLDDTNEQHRETGIAAGCAFLSQCTELWAYTPEHRPEAPTNGMQMEIKLAEKLGIPVLRNPPEWNSIK